MNEAWRSRRVIVDTRCSRRTLHFPTDATLLNRAREKLVKLAKKRGVELRQSYTRVGKFELIRMSVTPMAAVQTRQQGFAQLKTYLAA